MTTEYKKKLLGAHKTMKMPMLYLLTAGLALAQAPPTGIHATAQCENIKTNVLGITDLADCNIGITNYSAATVIISQAQIREFFPALSIEDPGRAQAVADKAFNSSKKSKAIAALNFLSPLAVAFIGGGIIHASVEAVAAVSLANTAAQSFKGYLIGQQPNEAAFLPNLPQEITLTPYGTSGFSGVWTVLGSITYTQGVAGTARRMRMAKGTASPILTWQGTLPGIVAPMPPPVLKLSPGQPCPAGFECRSEVRPTTGAPVWAEWMWPQFLGLA